MKGSQPIGLGIVGLGRGFTLTLPALEHHPRMSLRGAFDLRPDARERFAREFQAMGYASLEELLAAPDIDAVYVATPHEFHAEQSVAALRAGKHVLVEKPMASSMAESKAMESAARVSGRVLVVGPSHGFDVPVRAAARLIASGRYGALRLVTALNFTDFMFRPRRPEEFDSARGGGVVFSQAAHQIDVVRQLVGRPVHSVRSVTGNWDPARPGEGAYTALLTFDGGVAASLTYSGYAHYDSDELVGWISELGRDKDPSAYGGARRTLAQLPPDGEVKAKLSRTYGDQAAGSATFPVRHNEHFGFILASCEAGDIKILPTGLLVYGNEQREFIYIDPPRFPRLNVIDEFVDAIAGKERTIHDARWGLDTMACCAALIESNARGADVAPQTIIENSHWEANLCRD